MKHLLLAVFFWGIWAGARGQLYDKTWVCGRYASTVVFNPGQIDTARFSPIINVKSQWACVSDKDGTFQFFTEGVNVYAYDGIQMVNGNELADNSINANYANGLTSFQNVIVLPKKGSQYYIIYQSQSDFAYSTQPWYFTDRLYYSLVDMSLQNGKGEVIEKRTQINSGNFMDGKLTACQHANGRDWWLLQRRYNFNSYFIYLVTPDSISFIREQQIGAVSYEPDAVGQSAFSYDGSMYATITGKSPLIILDFDRCEGVFSNPQTVNIPIDTFMFYGQQLVSGGGGDGLCFSPNNRFLYINTIDVLRQYDLLANPIDSSEQIIFFWTDSNEQLGQFNQMHLAPNGKIYVANYQGFTSALHVINYPDSAGSACGFVKWGLPIATNNANKIPNMVHYRMGALVGSGCDTLTGLNETAQIEKEKAIKVFPNPATNYVMIDYGFTDWSKGDAALEISNELGQVVHRQTLPRYSGFQKIDVSAFAAGLYMACIKRGTAVVAVAKFAKE